MLVAIVYKMTNNFCIQAAGFITQWSNIHHFIRRISSTAYNCNNLPLDDICGSKVYCCYEIGFKSHMYSYVYFI